MSWKNLLTKTRLHLDNSHPQKKVIFMEHTLTNPVPGGWCGVVGESVGSGARPGCTESWLPLSSCAISDKPLPTFEHLYNKDDAGNCS